MLNLYKCTRYVYIYMCVYIYIWIGSCVYLGVFIYVCMYLINRVCITPSPSTTIFPIYTGPMIMIYS